MDTFRTVHACYLPTKKYETIYALYFLAFSPGTGKTE